MNKKINEVSCGYNLVVNGKKYYAPNKTIEGFAYKDYEASAGEVVYIPEYAFTYTDLAFSVNGIDFYDVEDTYTYDDLYKLCQDRFDEFQDEEYGISFDNIDSMVDYVLYEIDWTYPETFIDEMSMQA